MEAVDLLNLVSRWFHILAAITAVGGTIFARFVVVPTLDPLDSGSRAELHAAMRARWSKIVAVAIALLLLSGLYNIAIISIDYRVPRWYHPVFGVKFLLAFAIFLIASLLTGRSNAAENIRKHLRFWLNLNIVLAVLVVCLSGVLRTADKVPKKPDPEKPAAAGDTAQNAAAGDATKKPAE